MRRFLAFVLFFFAAVPSGTADDTVGVEDMAGQVARLVSQVVRQHLAGCHLVLAATEQHSPIIQQLSR